MYKGQQLLLSRLLLEGSGVSGSKGGCSMGGGGCPPHPCAYTMLSLLQTKHTPPLSPCVSTATGTYEPKVQHKLSILHFIDQNGHKEHTFITVWATITIMHLPNKGRQQVCILIKAGFIYVRYSPCSLIQCETTTL